MVTRRLKAALAIGTAGILASCSAYHRIEDLGSDPKLAPISNPAPQAISLPMPQPPGSPADRIRFGSPARAAFSTIRVPAVSVTS